MLLLCSAAGVAQQSATATQTLTLEVRSVASIAVSGNPSPLVITKVSDDPQILSVDESSTRYSITSNRTGMKLALSIDKSLPTGTFLYANVESSRGVSLGKVPLSTPDAPVDVVTNIGRGVGNDQRIVYSFEADASVGTMAPETRTVFLTLTD
jgi:hypothetical protein